MVSDLDRVMQDLGRVKIELSDPEPLMAEIQRILEIKKQRRRIETTYLESKLVVNNDWDVLCEDESWLDINFLETETNIDVAQGKGPDHQTKGDKNSSLTGRIVARIDIVDRMMIIQIVTLLLRNQEYLVQKLWNPSQSLIS